MAKHRMHTLDECDAGWGYCPIIPADKFGPIEGTEQSFVGYHADAYGDWIGKTKVDWFLQGIAFVKRYEAWSPNNPFEPHWRMVAAANYEAK